MKCGICNLEMEDTTRFCLTIITNQTKDENGNFNMPEMQNIPYCDSCRDYIVNTHFKLVNIEQLKEVKRIRRLETIK